MTLETSQGIEVFQSSSSPKGKIDIDTDSLLFDPREAVDFTATIFQACFGIEELIEARALFDHAAGKSFPDDTFYDQRTSYFLEYFCTMYRPNSLNPIDRIRASSIWESLSFADKSKILFVENNRHSIYKLRKRKAKSMLLVDLIQGDHLKVEALDNQDFTHVNQSSMYQGFVFKKANFYYIGNGFLAHPETASKWIGKILKILIKSDRFDRKEFLLSLARTNIRYHRHPHVGSGQFYQDLASHLSAN